MAIYDPSSLGVAGNVIVFNDDGAGIDPVYMVHRRRPNNRDIRNFDSPLPGDNGISDFQTLLGRTDYILEGKMYPSNESKYEEGRRKLRKVADVRTTQLDPASDRGYVPYVWSETDGNKMIQMKILFVDMPEDVRQGIVQPFRLFCKVKYPVIQSATLKVASTGNQPGVITGFVGYPLQYPVLLGKNFYAITSQATNIGDVDAWPESIIIVGPVNKPRFTNLTTGEFIEVDVNLATNSDQLIITYDQENSSIEANGVSVLNKLSSDSDLFKIVTGNNSFQLTGTSMGAGAEGIISFYDAWPLS